MSLSSIAEPALNDIIIDIRNISKSYQIGDSRINVLKEINWQLKRGSWTTLLGASGSGKTTLLNLLGALEKPDCGELICDGINYALLGGKAAANFRNERIGFVFQSYHLLPELTILENVMLPGMMRKQKANFRLRAEELLVQVGLKNRLKHRPTELSGGEQQRAAIARSLINDPDILLADEPTGNLDAASGQEILEIFTTLRRNDRTIVMITHNEHITEYSDSTAVLENGQISVCS